MFNILKAEYKKFFKGKLFLSLMIVIAVFVAITIGLSAIILKSSNVPNSEMATTSFVSSFSVMNNVGFVILVFMIIVLVSDFSQNTIRNKVILGYSKNQIYLAGTIFTLSIALVVTTVYGLLNFIGTGIISGFGTIDFEYLILHWLVYMVSVGAIYAIVQVFANIFRSTGATIGIVFGFLILVMIVTAVLSMIWDPETVKIMNYLNPLMQMSYASVFEGLDMLWMITSSACYLGLAVGFGMYMNNKIDYK